MAENTYRLSNPFSRIVGFSFGAPAAGGDFFHPGFVYRIGTAEPTEYVDGSNGIASTMIKNIDRVFGIYRNEFDQYRALIGGQFQDYGSPALSADYPIAQGLIASASALGLQARALTSFDRMITDGNAEVVLTIGSPFATVRSMAGESEMFAAAQEGNDAVVTRLNVDGSFSELVYSHSTPDKSMFGVAAGSIKRMPVVNMRNDICFAVQRGLNGEAAYGFDVYINGDIAVAVNAPESGDFELINIAASADGFGLAYFLTPASGNPSIVVSSLIWNGSSYALTNQVFEVDISGGGQVFSDGANVGISADGAAYAWVVHSYDDGSVHLRAAVFSSLGAEVEYADTTSFSFSTNFFCIDLMQFQGKLFFLIDNNSSTSDGLTTFSDLALVRSTDAAWEAFAAGGSDTFSPRNQDNNTAFDPGYLRGTRDEAYFVAQHSGTGKFHLLGSDGTNRVLDDDLPAFSSRTYQGLMTSRDAAYALMATVTAGPVPHLYHIDNAGVVLEYAQPSDLAVPIPRAQITRMQEIAAWEAT